MIIRWFRARYRKIPAAIVAGSLIASAGASAFATVVTEMDAVNLPIVAADDASIGPEARGASATGAFDAPWSWLIIAALIGLAPLTVERYFNRKSAKRRYSRLDITMLETEVVELRALESLHRESAARLRNLTANIPGVVYQRAVRPDGTDSVTFVSDGVHDLTGYHPNDAMSDSRLFTEIIHGDDRERFAAMTEESAASLEPFEIDVRLVPKNGEPKWVRVISRPRQAEDGAVVWDGLMFDITNGKLAEQSLADAKEAAEIANRSKTDFLTNMSHEIRTPMNGVLGMASLLLQGDMTDDQRAGIETIQSSGDALLTILNDILDISKMEAGKLEIEHVEFDLAGVIESIPPLMAPAFREKSLDLCCVVAPDVPRLALGDPGRLRQVLLNLVGNSLKFTETGAVVIDVTRADGDASRAVVRFDITDTGIGIPDEVKTRLFNKFTQADSSTSRNFGGTGLGLAISKELCQLMGGDISVESEPGRGSTFSFTVALGVPEASDATTTFFGAPAAPLRVLVVEPSEHVRRATTHQLQSLGMRTHAFPDTASARAAIDGTDGIDRCDVAVISSYLTGSAAVDLASWLRDRDGWKNTRFVIMTGAEAREDVQPDAEHPFQGRLRKPIIPSQLLRSLDGALAESGKAAPDDSKGSIQASIRPGRSSRILLAEDNEVNQKVASAYLLRAGHRVDIVENGELAIAAVERDTYDVVLMDIQMPGMDGVAAIQAIRALGDEAARVPIIALTANAMVGDREKYLSMGADGYISKPIESSELFGAIGRCCGTEIVPPTTGPILGSRSAPDSTPEVDDETAEFMTSLDDLAEPKT